MTMTTETEIQRPPKGIRYQFNHDGTILRVPASGSGEIELIATLREGVLTYTSDSVKHYDPVVRRKLKEEGLKFDSVAVSPSAVPPPAQPPRNPAMGQKDPEKITWTETFAPKPPPDPVAVYVPETSLDALTVDQRKAINWLRQREGFPTQVEANPPPEPVRTRYGDKDSGYVSWLLRYYPAEFARKYGVVGMGTILETRTIVDNVNHTTRKAKVPVEGVISQRKTHLTLAHPDHRRKQGGNDE